MDDIKFLVKRNLMTSCLPCAADIHNECATPTYEFIDSIPIYYCCCPDTPSSLTIERIGRAGKDSEDMKDVISTGRKRAAELFPIKEGMSCEWKGLSRAGGGAIPITGCLNGVATDRHHGPDKSTLNNSEGNVHRICANCHNRWHTRNDQFYGPRPDAGRAFVPINGSACLAHDAITQATNKEIYDSEVYWKMNKLTKRID